MCDGVIKKIESRLVDWKRTYLSKAVRITLIKSFLSNHSTYFLSLFPFHTRVANRMEKIFHAFLLGGLEDEKKFHLHKWDKIYGPLSCGGLGIK